ncbi:TonB-dependent receptor [Sphingomonas oryzagri]|uniref:TonB-dependent siderophore receptor n=1 Tax=Sphingomonas oryzagri TaxID=3042314 RepID=A0ABT6MXF0_9SPHN|nr:TonB-dependent siderophore receptor [Sphingomonas oryzagri]MDH7637719.1 TonB-dependent siderophore receptor [Sphingomonas oryzagri]
MKSGVGLAAVATAMAVFPCPAQAQTANDTGSADAKSSAEIVVTGQQATKQVRSDGDLGALGQVDAMSTPFNITSYTARLILDQQAQTIGDVMKNDPAVRVTNGYANSSQMFVIRGFPLNGDDVAMDGLYGVTPRQLVSPELYDSVQVLNGASAFLFGAAPGGSGIGGGINLIPKRATENSFIRLTGTYTGASIFGGNVDASTRFGPDNDLGIRGNFVYRDGTGEIEHEKHGATVAGLSFDWRHGAGKLTVDLGYELQKANWVEPETFVGGAEVPEPPKNDHNYGQPWTYTHLRDIYGIVREEVEIAKDTKVFAAFGFRQGREKGNYSAITVTDAATGAGTAYGFPVAFNQDAYAGQVGLRSAFEIAGITNKVNVGASINWSEKRVAYIFEADPTTFNYATNLYTTPIVDEPPVVFGGGDFDHPTKTGDTNLGSIYASDTIGFLNDRVLVIGGARYQNMEINGYDYNTTQRNAHYNDHAVTPVVGVVVKPTSYLSLYANRIEGLAQGPEAPASTTNSGAIFAPYRSVQYEVGAKVSIASLTATASLYQIKQPSAYTDNTNTFVENGEQRNRGFELSVNGEASRYIRFIGGLTLNRAKQTKTAGGLQDGNYAIGVPKTQINFGVEVVPPFFDKLTVTGRVIHTSSQFVDIDNNLSIPSWTTYELGARYIIVTDSHPITLRATVDNITNKSYWQSSFGGYLLPGIPRTARLSATVEF